MHFEPHAVLGWTLGNVAGADRALRKWCVIGAILPDVDAIPFVFGAEAYGRWHHTFGHNVWLWAFRPCCRRPICIHHSVVTKRWRLLCPACSGKRSNRSPETLDLAQSPNPN